MKQRTVTIIMILITALLGMIAGAVLAFMSQKEVKAKSYLQHYEDNVEIHNVTVYTEALQLNEEGKFEFLKTDIPYATEALVYIVQKGDTLSEIGEYFEISEKELLSLNPEIENADMIYVGQHIKLYVAY